MKDLTPKYVSEHHKTAFKKAPARICWELSYFYDNFGTLFAEYPDVDPIYWDKEGQRWQRVG